jgi:hypothetical protein
MQKKDNLRKEKMILQVVKKCPVCEKDFEEKSVFVMSEKEDFFLAHVSCLECKIGLVAKITKMPFGLIGASIITDLEKEEVLNSVNNEPISADDVLRFYKKYSRK